MRTTTTQISLVPLASLALLATLLLMAAPTAGQESSPPSQADSAPATAQTADGDDGDAAARAEARRERIRRLRYGNLAEIELGDKQLRISYPDLLADSADYRAFEALAAGEVSAWTSGRAVKLLTHATLSFDGIVVPYGNVSPDYPGVYSLWPKRTADGWSLVFNNEADIWGSQRNPAADAVEVPLEHSGADQPAEKLTIEFVEVDPGAVLRIAWGDHQFLAKFEPAP